MDKEEFLFLIPGVLYGIAVFDLLSLVRNKKIYWESILWAALLFFTLVGMLFNLYDDLVLITSNILYYTIFLFSPIFFVQCCYLIAPSDPKADMKSGFEENRKYFFLSLGGVVLINTIVHLIAAQREHWIHTIIFLAVFGINAFFNKIYLRMIAAVSLIVLVIIGYLRHL